MRNKLFKQFIFLCIYFSIHFCFSIYLFLCFFKPMNVILSILGSMKELLISPTLQENSSFCKTYILLVTYSNLSSRKRM